MILYILYISSKKNVSNWHKGRIKRIKITVLKLISKYIELILTLEQPIFHTLKNISHIVISVITIKINIFVQLRFYPNENQY